MVALKNKLLSRQIQRFFGSGQSVPEKMMDFLHIVEETYCGYDGDIELLQNSIEISSSELRSAYRKQQEYIISQQNLLEKIQEAIFKLQDENAAVDDEMRTKSYDSDYLINILLKHIEEKKATEIKLRKLSQAVEQSSASVVITNLDGEIEYVNPKFTESTGYTFDEVVGKNPRILKSGNQPRESYKKLWENISEGKVWRGEFHNRKKNGELFWESASISAITSPDGEITHYLAVKDDITKRKQVEADLKLAKEQAEAANRAKSEFLASMSHEIRTPMNSILGFSEVMLNTTNDPKQKSFLKTILDSGKTLLLLINDILDLSKIEAGRMEISPEPADLRVIVNEMKQIFDQKAKEKNLDFIVEIDADFPQTVLIDEIRFRQILLNLTGNAIKFTHKGYVKIQITVLRDENGFIDFEISVIDTGIGVAEKDKQRIFESFTQQSGQDTRKYAGTGLGLTITKRLCELMNGKIGVESEKGIYSRFFARFYDIKYSDEVIEQNNFYTWDEDELIFVGSKILVVDDVPFNRSLVLTYLENHNLQLFEAENGEMAIELCNGYDFDLILMDIRMPGMNGYEATELIKNTRKLAHIPVIALTASTMKSDFDKVQYLFEGYLRKPIQKKSLINELIKFLPFEQQTKNEAVSQIETFPVNKISYSDISAEVKTLFNKELCPEIEKQVNCMIIDGLEALVLKLMEFAELHAVGQLLDKTNDLKESIESFDIERIQASLYAIVSIFNDKPVLDEPN
ncbi:MAG TPA: hybrid sensor histidine kinase/response regulator [Saprospirales bacterium]|nr:hybrid sensor histidine kinase/response regulator [Saprospirales bacterium]